MSSHAMKLEWLAHSIGKSYGSYEELVQDKDVEIIYVGSTHQAHKDNSLLALRAGNRFFHLHTKPFRRSFHSIELSSFYEKVSMCYVRKHLLPMQAKLR
jgi:hypothetical protein